MNDKSVIAMVEERLRISQDYQQPSFSRAVENDKLYANVIDESANPYLSNISLPWPYIIIESYLGKCIQVMAATLPYCRVVEEDDDSRKKAKMVERDANMVLYKQKWPIFAYQVYKQAFKYGTGFIFERPWGNYMGEEMPIFSLWNFFNVFYNPNCMSFDEEDAYVIYESYVPMSVYKKYKNNPEYKNLNNIQTYSGSIKNTFEQEVMSAREIPQPAADRYSKLVKQRLYIDHQNMFVVTNDTNVIRNGKNFLDGHIPVKVVKPIPLDDDFLGMSILEQGKGLFSECNENRNQYNDAVWLMLNPHWIVDRNAGLKKTNILSKSGGLTFMDDINGLKSVPVDWNILAQSIARGGLIEKDLQNYSNAFPQMRGQPGMSQGTATGDVMMRQAGELRSDTYNLLLSMMSIEDMVQDIVRFKRIFMTDESSFYYWPEGKVQKATPEDYNGRFTYKAIAGYKQAREIERKQMIEAMTLIFGNQAFLPLVLPKANEWLDRLIDYFDLRSPEQLYVTDEETQANSMNQMLMSIMQGIGGGGGGDGGGSPQLNLGQKAMRMGPEQGQNPMMTNLLSSVQNTGG
jgi:hypothetical protein